jgi:signal transduction histidine kinase
LWHFRDPRSAAGEEEVAAMTGRNVISLAEERGLWAGTQEGELWREVDGAWRVQTNFTQSHPITAIVSDKAGGVWVGTDGGGLLRLQGEGYLRISKHGGLLSDFIRTLYLDQQGTLWIGTAGAGLSRWRDGHLKTFTTREGLPDNTISQILEDGIGRLWLGSNRGIACVRKDELEQLAWGKAPALYPQVYGKAEGMLSEECTGGFFPAGLKTKSRLLWFSTLKGIVVADPRPKAADVPAPAVLLEEMLVDGEQVGGQRSEVRGRRSEVGDQDSGLSVRIPPGQHRLEFHYTGLSFSAPDRVRFRYRLEPLDPDWVEAGTRRTAFYGYVPPGPYAFHVSACTSDGRWNEHAATIGLTVLPHFWQSRWFLGIGALGLLAAVGGAVRIFEKRRHQLQFKRLEQEHALERERARIAQDLHDDLGSSLTRISLLSDLLKSDKDNPSQVATHADKISQSAGQTVRALEEIVWALRPGSDSLQSLVEYIAHFANEMFEDDPTRCRLDLPHDLPTRVLPPEMRHNIFLIVKEALTNALKHAGAKEVRVQAKASSNWLEITIEDDGRGFDVAQDTELRTQDSAPRRRHGLGNMRERAAAMRGTLKVQSIPHQGTSVTLRVNFPPHIHAVEKHPQVVAINSA